MPRGQENSISVKTISDAYKHTSQDVPDELIEREDWNQEIVQVQICQRIQDEIERLEKTRTDSNPFLLSSDLKIQILNRLLQLILAPESFKSDVRHRYFGDKDRNGKDTQKQSSKTLEEIINRLYQDETYCLNQGKIDKVKNKTLIEEKRGQGNSTNAKFYEDLKSQFGPLEISPPVIKKYTLHKNKEGVLDPIHDQGKIFFEWNDEKEIFSYRVIDTTGKEVSSTITKDKLEEQLKTHHLYNNFREAANSSTATPRLIPFLPDILQITHNNGDTHPPEERRTFTRIVYLGDSLTDKGQMYDSWIGIWSGLIGTSPHKSFTNGPVWAVGVDNAMAVELLRQVIAEQLGIPYRGFDTCSQEERDRIAENMDGVMEHIKANRKTYENHFTLDDDNNFTIKDDNGHEVVFSRTQAIGGLTAHNYFGKLSLNPKLTFTRLLLSTLEEQCNKLLEADEDATEEERAHTVVHILAGPNDLVTVNERPTFEEVQKAVEAIFDAMEKLHKEGYRQFDLSNIPNIGKTPRFLLQSYLEQLNAGLCSEDFCHHLAAKARLFKNKHPDCQVNIFNMHHLLEEGLSKPKEYGFSTEYDLVKVKDPSDATGQQKDSEIKEKDWNDLTTLANGCGFYRIKDAMGEDELNSKLATLVNHAAYVRHESKLYYVSKRGDFLYRDELKVTKQELKEFDDNIKCADNVRSLPRNKWEKIKHFVEKKESRTGISSFNPQFLPHKNKIYYKVQGDAIDYRVMDPYDRVRQGVITKEQIALQSNGCALLRSPKPPIKDDKFVDIDVPSGQAYVRYENELYYIYRTSVGSEKPAYKFVKINLTLEGLDEIDADFKPWFASRQLNEREQINIENKIHRLGDINFSSTKALPLTVKFDDTKLPHYLPFIQAIIAEEGNVVARGDLYTPAQDRKAFKRVIEESGAIEPGDVVPVSNTAFNDLLHPIADFGAQWASKFFNMFLMRFHRFKPALDKFKNLIAEIPALKSRIDKTHKPDNDKNKSELFASESDEENKDSLILLDDDSDKSHDKGKGKETPAEIKPKDEEPQIEASALVRSFATAYSQKFAAEKKIANNFILRLFSGPKYLEPNLLDTKFLRDNEKVLERILGYAFNKVRTKAVLVELGWCEKTSSKDLKLTAWAEKCNALQTAFNNHSKSAVKTKFVAKKL